MAKHPPFIALADTRACKAAGDLDGFVREVMSDAAKLICEAHQANPSDELMHEQDVRDEINTATTTALLERLHDDIRALHRDIAKRYQAPDSGPDFDVAAAYSHATANVNLWVTEFSQAWVAYIKRHNAGKPCQPVKKHKIMLASMPATYKAGSLQGLVAECRAEGLRRMMENNTHTRKTWRWRYHIGWLVFTCSALIPRITNDLPRCYPRHRHRHAWLNKCGKVGQAIARWLSEIHIRWFCYWHVTRLIGQLLRAM